MAALSACAEQAQILRTDYCALAERQVIRNLCEAGNLPKASGAWGSCTILTRADAERVAAEVAKYDRRCRKEETAI